MKESAIITWTPSPFKKATCALTAFVLYLKEKNIANLPLYDQQALHKWSISHSQAFWDAVASFTLLPLYAYNSPPLDPRLPRLLHQSFLRNYSLNFAEAVLRHADYEPNKQAILYAEETGPIESVSFSALSELVSRIATGLRRENVGKGDHVAAIVANTPYAVAAMLATAAVGAVWSSCSPEFGPAAVISRLSQTKPRVLFFSSSHVYKGRTFHSISRIPTILDAVPSIEALVPLPSNLVALPLSLPQLSTRVVFYHWDSFTAENLPLSYEPVSFYEPLVTMFSSGTTGAPKCMVQGPGIVLNQVKEHMLHLDITPSTTVFYATSTGWMLFNWLVACLATGAKIVLYNGAAVPPSDPLRMIHIAADARVTHFGSGAKYFQTLTSNSNSPNLCIPTLTTVMGTGSPSTDEHFLSVRNCFGPVQYVSMSGGTEINGCFALGSPWMSVRVPELQCAGLGMDVAVFNEAGEDIVSQSGELVCRNASPCMPLYFLGDKDHVRYRSSYFERYGENIWAHGDFAEHTASDGFIITGRSDSTLNPGGVRIGTADLYEVVEKIDEIEGALVAEQTIDGNSRIIMLVVLRQALSLDDALRRHISQRLSERLSPRHVPHKILQVPQIPLTFSGKKCEVPIKRMLHGRALNNREAVQNPKAFEEIRTELTRHGLLVSSPRTKSAFPPCKL